MLAAIRGFAKSPFAVLLMGLLIVSFAVWGVRDMFKQTMTSWVVKAGSHEVSAEDYKRQFDRVIREAEQRMGRGITPEEAVAQNVDKRILSSMSDQAAFAELVKRLGIQPDDKLILASLAANPSFTDPLTGKFNDKFYRRVLAENQIRPESLEAELRDQIAVEQFAAGLGGDDKAPRIYSALMATFALEQRGADYIVLGEHAVAAPAKPTDAQLLAFMKENAAQLKQPEFRTISLVRFSTAAMAKDMPADPAAVQKRFDQEKAGLAQPERRAFIQISLKDPGQAAAAAGRLAKGETPAAVAKATGGSMIAFPATSRRAIPDTAIANAVFSLQPGQSSGPIRTGFGTALVKLTGVTPAKEASLDAERARIETEVKQEAAQQKVFDQVQKYSDARDGGAPMVKAAEAAGVKVYPLGPLTAEGVDKASRTKIDALTQKMLNDAFSQPQGGETDVQDLGKGEYYAVRVESITPSALPPLEDVRAPLTQRVMMVDLVKRLQAKADELAARLKKGEPIDKVAASAGQQVRHMQGLSRVTANQHQDLGQAFLEKVLSGKPGDTFVAPGPAGVAVGRIGPAQAGDTATLAIFAEQRRGQLAQMMMNDTSETLRNIARDRIKPKVNMAKARQTIGLSAQDPAASGKPAKAG